MVNISERTYAEAWAASSRELDKKDFYKKILGNLNLEGKKVVEFGIGGIEAKRIYEQHPSCLLGLDNNLEVIEHSTGYLKETSLPVKTLVEEGGINHLYRPGWNINKGAINLALADYTDASTIDPTLKEEFEVGIFTFTGGQDYFPYYPRSPFLDPLIACNLLLKPGGVFYSTDRSFTNDPLGLQKSEIEMPPGYRLKSHKVEVKREAVAASLWGNNAVKTNLGGQTRPIGNSKFKEGELADIVLNFYESQGWKPIISTMEIVKV